MTISLAEAQELHEHIGAALDMARDMHAACMTGVLLRARELAAVLVSDLLIEDQPSRCARCGYEPIGSKPEGWLCGICRDLVGRFGK